MHRFIRDSLINFVTTNLTPSCYTRPVVVTYHITHRCNLRCFFCAECGLDRNKRWEAEGELDTEASLKLLKMLSRRFAYLYVTGGEPFLRADTVRILNEARAMRFRNITVNTNLSFIERVESALDSIDNLVVSIDSVEPERFDRIRGVKGMGAVILKNLEKVSKLQMSQKFRLHINCVVTPSTIEDARGVLRYCAERKIKVGINAQNDKHGPIKDLLDNPDFRRLVSEMMEVKKRIGLITGTKHYYEQMFGFVPYKCYPFLTPRINAGGSIAYPCDNLDQWVPDILRFKKWRDVEREARRLYGRIPKCTRSCQFQCYIEPSKMVKKPWLAVKEYL